jgi:hypothetical protein
VNLYEQLANMTDNANLKAILLDVAKEEKTHAGEFQALLLRKYCRARLIRPSTALGLVSRTSAISW